MNAVPPLDDVTVVCVTYNSSAILESMAHTLSQFRNVVLIDNASDDETVARAKLLLPHARIIERTSNAGFGSANNQAMAMVRTPFALLLNPDCTIAPPDVQRLLACMQRFPKAGVVGPQNWRSETVAQVSHRNAFFKPDTKDLSQLPKKVVKAEWIHGCCQLIRATAFHRIGGFDEVFFLYYEDDDLCLRMGQAGYDCLLEPAARSFHRGGASSVPSIRTEFIKRFHYARSRQIAIRRYMGTGAARLHLTKLILASVPAILVYGLLLRRKHVIKWAGWGYAALAASLSLNVMPGRRGAKSKAGIQP